MAERSEILIDSQRLERQLLRRSVGMLRDDCHCCADCGRTPLVGEHLHIYDRGELVCELCRMLRPTLPVSSARVRHGEMGSAVRIRRAA